MIEPKITSNKNNTPAPNNSGGGATGGRRGHWERRDEQRPADWELWAYIPHCEYWIAVALSLDLEPPEYESSVGGWPPEYERRLKIAYAHIQCKNLARSKADCGWGCVDLSVFCEWAQSQGWSLPDNFPRPNKQSGKLANTRDEDIPAAKVKAGTDTSPSGDDVEEQAQASDSNNQSDTANLVYWRVILNSNIKKIDADKKAHVRNVIKYLRALGDKRLPNKGGNDELIWLDDMGTEQLVEKKTVSNAASDARQLP